MENQTKKVKPTATRAEVEAWLAHVQRHTIYWGVGMFFVSLLVFGWGVALMAGVMYYLTQKDSVKKELEKIQSEYDIEGEDPYSIE